MKIVNGSNFEEMKLAVRENMGQCPCVAPWARTKDTKCMCKEFREQTTEGECHCGMYRKELRND